MSVIDDANNYLKDVLLDGINEEYKRDHPLFDAISKPDTLGGLNGKYNVQIGAGQGTALGDDSIGKSQTYSTQSKSVVFALLPSIQEVEALLPLTQLEISLRGDRYAFGTLIEAEVDSKWESIIVARARQLYRGNNVRGQISAISTNLLTLAVPEDAIMIEVGMTINAGPNSNGSSPRTGSAVVDAVDIDSGTFTVDNAAGITSLAVNDYVFSAAEIGELPLEGLALSTPATAPTTGDSFRGIDRSIDVVRLSGSRLPTSQQHGPVEQAIMKVAARMKAIGARGDFASMSPDRGAEFSMRLGAKAFYKPGDDAYYGFMSFMVNTALGPLEVIQDPDCPFNTSWIGDMASHEISTVDDIVRYSNVSGFEGVYFYPKPTNSQIAVRMRSVGQYRQMKPRNFGVAQIG